MKARLLIAGIGNVFLGDDAFGVGVAQGLAARKATDGVEVVDFGIRGFDLACALIEGYDGAILVDALQRGGPPGTLYVIEPDLAGEMEQPPGPLELHALEPFKALRLAKALGGSLPWVRIVGCEPESFEEPGLGHRVQAAVDEAIALVDSLVVEFFTR